MSYEGDYRKGLSGGSPQNTEGWNAGAMQRYSDTVERQRDERRRAELEANERYRVQAQSGSTSWGTGGWNSGSHSGGGKSMLSFAKACALLALAFTVWYGLAVADWSGPMFVACAVGFTLAGAIAGAVLYIVLRVLMYVLAIALSVSALVLILHMLGLANASTVYFWVRTTLGM